MHSQYQGPPLSVLVTGSSGLVGSVLLPFLTVRGHGVTPLVRTAPGPAEPGPYWNPETGVIHTDGLEGLGAVVHLAGESISGGRWTPDKKRRIRDSRVAGTRLLCEALGSLTIPPRTLVSASAIGFYGNRGDELLNESSPGGGGYLADVCAEWEAATAPAREAGIRVVLLRFGVVLALEGGALARMRLPFQLGVGGILGSGRQYMSWIALDDAVGAICHALVTEELEGAVNAVAPDPVTNWEFTKTLGRVLRRPTLLPMPAFAARLAFGEMADELLLASARVFPGKLLKSGYRFRAPRIEGALRHLLGREEGSLERG